MKYSLRCPVTCKIRLPESETTLWDDLVIRLEIDAQGYLAFVSVTASGLDPTNYQCAVNVDHATHVLRIQENRDEALHARMMGAIHALESFLCFYGNLEAIHWEAAEAHVEAETEVEGGNLNVRSWRVMMALEDPIVDFSQEQLSAILAHARRCSSLTTTLSFHRAGINDVRMGQNISAFFNFYFVIEGLYGNGKWRSKDVKPEFLRSKILVQAIEEVIAAGFPKAMGEDVSVLELLGHVKRARDAGGLIHLLVDTRGDLHHYAGAKKKTSGSPLMNERYRSLAQFAMQVSRYALLAELKEMERNGQ